MIERDRERAVDREHLSESESDCATERLSDGARAMERARAIERLYSQ